jgi:peptidyl-prolyl cis-trans isomerase D
MAKSSKPKASLQSKKHLARLERERIYRRNILIVTIAVLVIVVGLVGFGILNNTVLKANQPVAVVNGERITTKAWQAQVRYARNRLVSSAQQEFQFIQMLGNDPNSIGQFANDLMNVQSQLAPETIGKQVLDTMVDDALVRQEAKRRGITVTKAEVDHYIQDALGYYPNGTPTAEPTLPISPTATLTSLQMTLVPPTATPTETAIPTPTLTPTVTAVVTATATIAVTPTASPSPTITPTELPTATPTEYTQEGFQTRYKDTLDNLQKNVNFNGSDLIYLVTNQLYRQKVQKAVLDELNVKPEEEQVWARHILVADEATAKNIEDQLSKGADFCKLAAQYSTDTSNKDNCGDLGWFGKGQMVPEFETAAWALQVGQISQPVQTSFGWHIIQVLGHENRPLDSTAFQQLQSQSFQTWLTDLRNKSTVDIKSYWTDRVPTEPTLPSQITDFLNQIQQQQQSQPLLPTAPVTPQAPTTPQATP